MDAKQSPLQHPSTNIPIYIYIYQPKRIMREHSNSSSQVPIATIGIIFHMTRAIYQWYYEFYFHRMVSYSIAPIGTVSHSIAYSGAAIYNIDSTLQRYTCYRFPLPAAYCLLLIAHCVRSCFTHPSDFVDVYLKMSLFWKYC